MANASNVSCDRCIGVHSAGNSPCICGCHDPVYPVRVDAWICSDGESFGGRAPAERHEQDITARAKLRAKLAVK